MTSREIGFEPEVQNVDARIAMYEQSVGGPVPLADDEDVAHLQFELQHDVADAASDLMTGLHLRSEQREYIRRYAVYRRLLGAVALDAAQRSYENHDNDMGVVKREVFGYLQHSKRQMVALDYQKRLEKSRLERAKQWLAHHRKTRFAGTFAVSGATSSGLFMMGEEMAPMLEFSQSQRTGIVGVATIAGMLAMRSILKSGPTKAGAVLSRQFNSTLRTYELEKKQRKRVVEQTLEDMPATYAEKHLAVPFGVAAMYLTNFEFDKSADTTEQFKAMVAGTLDLTENSLLESYNINTEKLARAPWYRRFGKARG